MPPTTLKDLALRACLRNIANVTTVGDLPFELVREIIQRVPSAAQLELIEKNSPQIRGETAEMWGKFIKRDFPRYAEKKRYVPPDPTKWSSVYRKYKREDDAMLESAVKAMRESMGAHQAKRQENVSRELETGGCMPLRSPGRRWGGDRAPSMNAGSRTKTTSGESIMRKVRREAAVHAHATSNLLRISFESTRVPSYGVRINRPTLLNGRPVNSRATHHSDKRASGSGVRSSGAGGRSETDAEKGPPRPDNPKKRKADDPDGDYYHIISDSEDDGPDPEEKPGKPRKPSTPSTRVTPPQRPKLTPRPVSSKAASPSSSSSSPPPPPAASPPKAGRPMAAGAVTKIQLPDKKVDIFMKRPKRVRQH